MQTCIAWLGTIRRMRVTLVGWIKHGHNGLSRRLMAESFRWGQTRFSVFDVIEIAG